MLKNQHCLTAGGARRKAAYDANTNDPPHLRDSGTPRRKARSALSRMLRRRGARMTTGDAESGAFVFTAQTPRAVGPLNETLSQKAVNLHRRKPPPPARPSLRQYPSASAQFGTSAHVPAERALKWTGIRIPLCDGPPLLSARGERKGHGARDPSRRKDAEHGPRSLGAQKR